MNNLIVNLTHSSTAPVSLKALLAHNFVDGVFPADCNVVVTVAAHVTATVHDDILHFSDLERQPITKHSITLQLHEASTLTYEMKLIPVVATEEGSSLQLVHSSDKALVKKEVNVHLLGANAHATVLCTCYGNGNRLITFKTLQDHVAPDAQSNVLIKSVLDENARMVCNSMIKIHKEAQHTNAEQANKNILLGTAARAVSIPQLEIEANDVKCKHGAAVSNVNNEHLFYLQSRGLNLEQARHMIIEGFLN